MIEQMQRHFKETGFDNLASKKRLPTKYFFNLRLLESRGSALNSFYPLMQIQWKEIRLHWGAKDHSESNYRRFCHYRDGTELLFILLYFWD